MHISFVIWRLLHEKRGYNGRCKRRMADLNTLHNNIPNTYFSPVCPLVYYSSTQWGTWKSGVSLINTGIRHPSSVMKNVIPVVMAGGKSNIFCDSAMPEARLLTVPTTIAISLILFFRVGFDDKLLWRMNAQLLVSTGLSLQSF